MTRFRGLYEYSIDEKGRVNIPAKFRKVLNPQADETFVVARGPNNCLRAYPQDEWKKFENELDARPQTPQTVRLRRQLYASLADSTLDGQGRITITPLQMQISGITKKTVLVGQGPYVEMWEPGRYEGYLGTGEDFDDVFYQSARDGQRRPDESAGGAGS